MDKFPSEYSYSFAIILYVLCPSYGQFISYENNSRCSRWSLILPALEKVKGKRDMTCYTGFGNMFDGQHPVWTADFTGNGSTQTLFYYIGDGNWWLADMAGGQLQWSLVSQSAGFGNLMDGQHPIYFGDFTGVGRTQIMFYYAGDGNWWLGDLVGGQLQWSLVSQSAGFGNLLDGQHPIYIADFTGVGHAQIMFYYAGDGNWWLGDMIAGQLQWSLVSQSAGFGNLLDGQHPIWIGDFIGAGRTQVLIYYAGDGNWWLGDMITGQLQWSLISQSAGFGNLLDGQHPIYIANFSGAGRAQIMFYYTGDGNWWLGDLINGQLQWNLVSQTAGFGNLIDGQHPIWITDFLEVGHAQIMFYYAGDGNWWLADLVGGQLQWSLVSQSAGFGNLLDGQHPMWIADFSGVGHPQFMIYYAGDGNWWLGDMVDGQLLWSLASQTAGFGNLIDGQHPVWIGDFMGVGHAQILFYYTGDGNWWLGSYNVNQIDWSFVGNTGRPCPEQITVHFKSLLPINANIQNFIDVQFSNMSELFSLNQIACYFGTTEDLSGDPNLAALTTLDAGPCILGQPTADHNTLFQFRANADVDDIVVYIVQSIVNGTNPTNLLGCATHPAAFPGAVVVQSTALWLTAHEVGHVLDLRHITNADRLMNPNVGWTNVPPDLIQSERTTMISSQWSVPC